jgi:hypothetical protein
MEKIYEIVLVRVSYLTPLNVPTGGTAAPLTNTCQTAQRTERVLYVSPDALKI